jgi:hypothetical protein
MVVARGNWVTEVIIIVGLLKCLFLILNILILILCLNLFKLLIIINLLSILLVNTSIRSSLIWTNKFNSLLRYTILAWLYLKLHRRSLVGYIEIILIRIWVYRNGFLSIFQKMTFM